MAHASTIAAQIWSNASFKTVWGLLGPSWFGLRAARPKILDFEKIGFVPPQTPSDNDMHICVCCAK